MSNQNVVTAAKALINTGAFVCAWEHLIANGEELPTSAESCVVGAEALRGTWRFKAALERVMAWHKTKEPNAYVARMAGILYKDIGRIQDSIEMLLVAQRIGPSDPRIANMILELVEKSIENKPMNFARILPKFQLPSPTLPKFFRDWSDMVGWLLFCIHILLLSFYVLIPLAQAQNLSNHPAWKMIVNFVHKTSSVELSTHVQLTISLVVATIIAGIFFQRTPQKNLSDTEVFFRTRSLRTYHYHWLVLFSLLTAALYTNTDRFSLPYKESISTMFGILTIGSFMSCAWLFIPGARTSIQLLRTSSERANRICITRGVLFRSTTTFLPQMLRVAQVKAGPFWLFTLTDRLEVVLAKEEELDRDCKKNVLILEAPSSFVETRALANLINAAINDAKILQGH